MSANIPLVENSQAVFALLQRVLALDTLSPAARVLEEKAIIAEFERLRLEAVQLRVAQPGPSAARAAFEHDRKRERALRFAYELVKDEIKQGHPGHDNVMVALEVILRPVGAEPRLAAGPDAVEAINGLATLLADAHTRLMCAGYPDDAGLEAVKTARDWARSLAKPDSARKPQPSAGNTSAGNESKNHP